MKLRAHISISSLTHKLKDRHRTWSQVCWLSASDFNLWVVGFLGVAALIFSISKGKMGNFSSLPWLSEKKSSLEELQWVPGLQNVGNNCFMNVILQALASCFCFHPFLQKIIVESESSLDEEQVKGLPLTVALADLLRELCTRCGGRTVLNPQKVMCAMHSYIPQFNLSRQQDAAEAFLHLLSSLREEFTACYLPNYGSLADFSAFTNCRILPSRGINVQSEHERWKNHFIGPFDGILGSILTCQTCSFQISLNFEYFHSLPLSPVTNDGTGIVVGCTLEDCLKQFVVADRVENYHCNHCWHTAAVKYLSLREETEGEIGKLKCCTEHDFCDCRRTLHLEALPWSNNYSCTFKQLSIARCPKILCIHIQRVSVNEFGELFKLQGHISFPLMLDLSPYVKTGVEVRNWEETFQRGDAEQQYPRSISPLKHFYMQYDTGMINPIYGLIGDKICSEALVAEQGCSETELAGIYMRSHEKEGNLALRCPTYNLVSLVEHFGGAGSGHYIVYRRMRAESGETHWFSISDCEVYSVSETDVLAAEASLLFYERITES